MRLIRDDPIVRCLERRGLSPWMLSGDLRQTESEPPREEDDDGEDQETLLD